LAEFAFSFPNSSIMGYDYHNHTALLVIKNGWILGEWYLRPESKTFQQYLASNGKSFTYVLFGILMQEAKEGKLEVPELSEQSKLYDPLWLSHGYPLSDPRKAEITFEQVFQHTSGLIPETTAEGEQVERGRYHWTHYGDWVVGRDARFPQTGQLFFDPGKPEQYEGSEVWGQHRGAYSSLAFAHLGIVFRHLTGQAADTILWEKLLKPLGFDGISYYYPAGGYHRWFTAGGVQMTARDYARFCYLLLKKGRWHQQQLVNADWIQRTYSSPKYQNLRSNVDGYLGEDLPKDMLRIYGSGGNFAYIIPSEDLIILHSRRMSNLFMDDLERGIRARIPQLLGGRKKP
jgi:CubicO group peptidase (beta-lactamase class C family)